MINKKVFTKEYIQGLCSKHLCDPSLIERNIFALGLLEALSKTKAEFIFKGGTSIMLLTDFPYRLSTDIDIIVEPGYDIKKHIIEASKIYPFIRYEEPTRNGANKIKKQHFSIFYKSISDPTKEVKILLDVLYENNNYARTIRKEIKNSLIETTGEPTYVYMPDANSLLGDKLTAFAPTTIGIKPISIYSSEIINRRVDVIKQFLDVAFLFDYMNDFRSVRETYIKISKQETLYRGKDYSYKETIDDTYYSALSLLTKGKFYPEIYKSLYDGARRIKGYLLKKINGEDIYREAIKVMYISACVLKDVEPVNDIPKSNLLNKEYSRINKIKKIDEEYFNLAALAIKIHDEI